MLKTSKVGSPEGGGGGGGGEGRGGGKEGERILSCNMRVGTWGERRNL